MSNQPKKCSLCGQELTDCGHNPEPVLMHDGSPPSGPCCDECNSKYVVPARLRKMLAGSRVKLLKE